mmetsp:Transcript_91850/g.145256  ORF Transcript_91850/g.145256 Transcript_91850/m.145256 type:complete len:207 (-) Transcript_91850:444-1064(-)
MSCRSCDFLRASGRAGGVPHDCNADKSTLQLLAPLWPPPPKHSVISREFSPSRPRTESLILPLGSPSTSYMTQPKPRKPRDFDFNAIRCPISLRNSPRFVITPRQRMPFAGVMFSSNVRSISSAIASSVALRDAAPIFITASVLSLRSDSKSCGFVFGFMSRHKEANPALKFLLPSSHQRQISASSIKRKICISFFVSSASRNNRL